MALIVVSVGLTGVSISFADAPSHANAPLEPQNTGIFMLSELAARQDVSTRTLVTLPYVLREHEAPTVILLVTSLDTEIAPDATGEMTRLVEDGGHVIVAFARGHSNSVATAFGIEFDGRAILSGRGGSAELTAARGIAPAIAAVTPIYLRSSGALPPPEPFLWSGNDTYLDLNGDGLIGQGDRAGPFIAAARIEHPSGGSATFIGGDSLFQDGGLQPAFAEGLLRERLPHGGTMILFDGMRAHAVQPVFTLLSIMETVTRHSQWAPPFLLAIASAAGAAATLHRGAGTLEHTYRGADARYREEREDRIEDLRKFVHEQARQRAGISPAEFVALSAHEREALIASAVSVADQAIQPSVTRSQTHLGARA